jgi:Protein of unknown function (DUF2892)
MIRCYKVNRILFDQTALPIYDALCDRADRGDEMLYRKNMGSKESWARVLGGALIVACSLTQIGLTPLGLVLAASGVFTALTGLFGFCPACAMAGRIPLETPR